MQLKAQDLKGQKLSHSKGHWTSSETKQGSCGTKPKMISITSTAACPIRVIQSIKMVQHSHVQDDTELSPSKTNFMQRYPEE